MENLQQSTMGRLIRRLDREIRSRGQGSISGVDRAVGFQRGWWQNRVKAGNLSVAHLFKVLDHLGLDPVKFIRQSVGREDGLELDRPRGEPPELVRRAWERFNLDEEARGVGLKWIETLDERQYEDPDEVVELAQWGVDHVELALLPQLLGVAGSAWRLAFFLDEAYQALLTAIQIADRQKNIPEKGRLLRRISSVIADQGDRQEALRVAEKAAIAGLQARNPEGVGSALVAQGIWLYYLDDYETALDTLRSALDFLPPHRSRNRLAVFQVSGLAHQSLGNLNSALKCLETAEAELPHENPWDAGKLLWLRARIYAARDELEASSQLLERVVSIFQKLHLAEAAVAACELVRVYLKQGRVEHAYRTASSLRTLVDPLSRNTIIAAAIADLLRAGREGLTLALVKRVIAQIESERQNAPEWQSLRIRKDYPSATGIDSRTDL